MSSQAVQDFCNTSRELEALRAQRKVETSQAREAKKAAEHILIETLGDGSRGKITIDDDPYLVRVLTRSVNSSYGSAIVDRMADLWKDPEGIKEQVIRSDAANMLDAFVTLLCKEAGVAPRQKTCLQVTPLKGKLSQDADIQDLEASQKDIASALVRAKKDLDYGRQEHLEELHQCQSRGKEAENALIHELSQLDAGHVKRVNMVESDGSSTSYYLRLKKTRSKPKRKISAKALRGYMHDMLSDTLNPMLSMQCLDTFCSEAYAQSFLKTLREKLQSHELGPESEDAEPVHRVALDKLRGAGR